MFMSTFTTDEPLAPAGFGLASLAASNLERRFYSWLGRSGRRYVCTVFRNGEALTSKLSGYLRPNGRSVKLTYRKPKRALVAQA
jgi:hypothetical protein